MVVSTEEVRREVPPAIAGVTPEKITTMLSERDADQDERLSRAEWTGPEAAFGATGCQRGRKTRRGGESSGS